MNTHEPWFPFARATSQRAPTLLLCLAHAGGAASGFRSWAAELPACEVLAVQLPGREHRLREPALTRMTDVLDRLVPACLPRLDRPFAIYGHSLGAALGFELALRLQDRGRAPALLAVSGRRAPSRPSAELLHTLPDHALIDYLRRLGGTPEALLRERELMAIMLPILRADLTLLETHQASAQRLRCDVLAVRGREDAMASPADIAAWAETTTGAFISHELPGGHFFAPPALAELHRHLRARIVAH